MITTLKKRIFSTAVAAALLGGGAVALATPAEAAGNYYFYWYGSKAQCDAALIKARPNLHGYVRLVHPCIANGSGYMYKVQFLF